MMTAVSLLERVRAGNDPAAWRRLDDLYRPLIRRWVQRDAALRDEFDDVVQEVMTVLVRELPRFHRERTGSFRRWLRTVTHNRVLASRQKHRRDRAGGDDGPLAQLADPNSELSRIWDVEHDQHILRRLLELLETDPPFEVKTIQAFRLVFFEENKPADVAAKLGLSVNTVLLAKSRVLKWLREESADFLK